MIDKKQNPYSSKELVSRKTKWPVREWFFKPANRSKRLKSFTVFTLGSFLLLLFIPNPSSWLWVAGMTSGIFVLFDVVFRPANKESLLLAKELKMLPPDYEFEFSKETEE